MPSVVVVLQRHSRNHPTTHPNPDHATPQVTLNPRFHAVNASTGLPAPLLGRVVLDEPNMVYRNVQVMVII